MSLPQVAIVILNFNGKHYLEKFLSSVMDSSYANKRVIVADNASTDDSVAYIQAHHPTVEIIQLDQNYGFAGGYNKALAQVTSDYFVLLNSDVEVTRGWIEPVITLMESDNTIAVCQPKLLAYHQKDTFEYAGAAGGWIDLLGYPLARGRVFEYCEKDEHQYDNATPVFWASGAAMFIRAKVYNAVGGLDEFFFAHQEEIDLCWRVQLAGYKIFFCPGSTVYHVGGGTLPKGHRKTFLNFRNNMIMLMKNMSIMEKSYTIPVRIAMDWLFACKSLFSGDTDSVKAVAQAHAAVIKWRFTKREKPMSSRKKMKDLDGVFRGSIVWRYFILKKKKFSEL